MKKQKIEDIFSSMENFSTVPPPELWIEIEEKLGKPKKKKRAVFWWSVAAGLLLGLAIPSALYFNSVLNSNNPNSISLDNNTVVIQEKNTDSKGMQSPLTKDEISKNSNQVKNTITVAIANKKQDAVVEEESKKSSFLKSNTGSQVVMQTGLVSNANKSNYLNGSHQETTNPLVEKSIDDANRNSNNNSSIVQKNETNVSIASMKVKPETDKLVMNAYGKDQATDLALAQNDSVQLAELQELENAFAKAENKNNKITPVPQNDKWSVQVFAGVSNSQNYKTESSLGSAVESKQGNAYGVKTNYKLNKKWGISSGFKFNELGQAIADVSYVHAQNNFGLATGNFFIQNSNVERVSTNANYVFISNNNQNGLKNSNFQTGTIDQSLKYIEMPLEVSYALLDRNKTSVSLNTGGFVGKLISNKVLLNGNSIGENLNVNEFVYGSLLSSTVQYRLYKQTRVFVEPGMNYYINPLNNQSFNQFQWAFNFGLNVSF